MKRLKRNERQRQQLLGDVSRGGRTVTGKQKVTGYEKEENEGEIKMHHQNFLHQSHPCNEFIKGEEGRDTGDATRHTAASGCVRGV